MQSSAIAASTRRRARAAVLVRKETRPCVRPPVDYIGLVSPDRYVFGYGMDYSGWRNAPGIYAVAE